MNLRLYTLVLCTAIGLSGLSAHAEQAAAARGHRAARRIGRSVSWIEVPQHRPGHDGRPHRRSRGARIEPRGLLRRHRHRRVVEDGEQRHDVGRAVRRSRRHRVDRRHRDQPQRRQHGVGRQRREQQSPERLVGQRPLQVDRRRQDLEAHGPRHVEAHRPHHRRSDRSRRGLRGGARQPVGARRRARHLQDHRRRPDVDAHPLRRRRHRRHRAGDGSVEQQGDLRGDLSAAPRDVGLQRRRPRQRDVEVERRRPHVDQADAGRAERSARPHRHGRLSRQPEHPLRAHRAREGKRHLSIG